MEMSYCYESFPKLHVLLGIVLSERGTSATSLAAAGPSISFTMALRAGVLMSLPEVLIVFIFHKANGHNIAFLNWCKLIQICFFRS